MSHKGIRPHGTGLVHTGCVLFAVFGMAGCAASQPRLVAPLTPPPALLAQEGSTHTVQPGESLWRIARSFGLDVNTLAAVNHLPSAKRLEAGQQLFIPLPVDADHFFWPVRGLVNDGAVGSGVSILAPEGTRVRAARRGVVALASWRLTGWGPTVILDHQNGFFSVYAGLAGLRVGAGQVVGQGMALGDLGSHAMHFEIREGTVAKDPLSLLPEA